MYFPPNPRKTPQFASKSNFEFFENLFQDQQLYQAHANIYIQTPNWDALNSMPEKLDGAFDIQTSFLHRAHFIKNPQIRQYFIQVTNQIFFLIQEQLFELNRTPQTLEQIFAGSWLNQIHQLYRQIHWFYEHDTGIQELTDNSHQVYSQIQADLQTHYHIQLSNHNWHKPRFTHIQELQDHVQKICTTFINNLKHPQLQNLQDLTQTQEIHSLSPYHKHHLAVMKNLYQNFQSLCQSLTILIHMHLEMTDIDTTNFRYSIMPQTSIQDFIQARLYPFMMQYLTKIDKDPSSADSTITNKTSEFSKQIQSKILNPPHDSTTIDK